MTEVCSGAAALNEAAERFRGLQAEKGMKQLQEDRRNDKKPPPYRHIKVHTHSHTQTHSHTHTHKLTHTLFLMVSQL